MARKQKKDKTLEIITHVIGIFSGLFGALLIFFLSEDKSVKKHARNALNWQISLLIYFVMIFVLSLIIALIRSLTTNAEIFVSSSLIISILTILNIVLCVIAAFKASEGELWVYPLSINIIDKIDEKDIKNTKKEIKKAYKEVRKDLKKESKKK